MEKKVEKSNLERWEGSGLLSDIKDEDIKLKLSDLMEKVLNILLKDPDYVLNADFTHTCIFPLLAKLGRESKMGLLEKVERDTEKLIKSLDSFFTKSQHIINNLGLNIFINSEVIIFTLFNKLIGELSLKDDFEFKEYKTYKSIFEEFDPSLSEESCEHLLKLFLIKDALEVFNDDNFSGMINSFKSVQKIN